MTSTSDLLVDSFVRIREEVVSVLDGLEARYVTWRADPEANTIAWLVWHLTRIQDDHVAGAFGVDQLWTRDGWVARFGLPFDPAETGYGQDHAAVGEVDVPADVLASYHEAVAERTITVLCGVDDDDLDRIVDDRWDPPVTLAVRLVSVIVDDLQHLGQAAYIRGLAERAGS
ncbi:MAG: DUF664 domain-containing protein [Acidimicrobiales bacterium]|nr:DUF664 domain-containing protein [Acidimicrobiales bacterium]